MTSCVEWETENSFSFSAEEILQTVACAVLTEEQCPYEASVSLLMTDNEGIRRYNREFRETDKETDVLSFPNLEFPSPGDFSFAEKSEADCFDPESGELILGDIVISAEKVHEQAENYGHGALREFAFLVAHSMFHLCGYDHMTEQDAALMEKKQEDILQKLGITRDI